MGKSLFEQMGETYRREGNYYLPTLLLPTKEERTIGIWGQRRRRYLKEHYRVLYYNLLTSCKLHEHLADVSEQAEKLFFRLVKDLAEKEGLSEKLKADNTMVWVQRMNNIRNRAPEIVSSEIVNV